MTNKKIHYTLVRSRLEAGEKAIDISIEAWKRRVANHSGKNKRRWKEISCALCCIHREDCNTCPYSKYSMGCGFGSPYTRYHPYASSREMSYKVAKQVLEGLQFTKKQMIKAGEY